LVNIVSPSETDIVKKLAAIAFATVLITAQAFAFADTTPAAAVKKPCCACHSKCCAGKNTSSTEKLPAVPAPTFTLKNLPAISGQTIVSISRDAPVTIAPAFSASDFVSLRNIPLFTRDCAFLI